MRYSTPLWTVKSVRVLTLLSRMTLSNTGFLSFWFIKVNDTLYLLYKRLTKFSQGKKWLQRDTTAPLSTQVYWHQFLFVQDLGFVLLVLTNFDVCIHIRSLLFEDLAGCNLSLTVTEVTCKTRHVNTGSHPIEHPLNTQSSNGHVLLIIRLTSCAQLICGAYLPAVLLCLKAMWDLY